MAKDVWAGELNTRINITREARTINENGFAVHTSQDIFGQPVYCRWQWLHGAEALEAMKHQLGQVATLTMYHSPLIDTTCRVTLTDEQQLIGTNDGPFDIVSIDAVENQGRYMEIKVKRRTEA